MRLLIILIPLLLIAAGIFYAGMATARHKDKARNESVSGVAEENLRLTRQNEEYAAALRSISAGRGASPEITASSALAVGQNYELG
jgi:hypothetical protein